MLSCLAKAGVAVLLAEMLPVAAIAQKQQLSIGIVTGQLANSTPQSFAPFTAWLDGRVPGHTFEMVQFATIDDLLQAVERRSVDFAFTTPVAMVELNVRYGARAIATVMQPITSGQNYPWLAGAVFVKDSRTDIRRMADARGKRVIALSPLALGGWLSVEREWRRLGIREDRDVASLRFVFSFDKVVDEVCQGKADIGILGANALILTAPLCPENLRVVPAAGGGRDPRYPTLISTELYPEEALAVTGEEDEAVVAQVATALLAVEPGSDVAKAATVAGFTAPLSYAPVQELMQELRLRPFESYGRPTVRQTMEQYGRWIVFALLGFLTILAWALMRARKLNTRLQASEKFRERVFEGSHVPIVVMDSETLRFLDCNSAATAIYGLSSREETLSKTPGDVSAPVQPDGALSEQQFQEYIQLATAKEEAVFEWRHRRPNGEFWDAEVHLMSFKAGQKKLLQFTLEDITDRRRAEEMRTTLASVLEASHDFIAIATMESTVTYLNRGARSLVGLEESDDAQTLRLQDFFGAKESDHFTSAIMPALRHAGWARAESRLRHFGTGRLIPVEIEGVVVRDREGAPIGLATVMRDLTERHEVEKQRDRLETRLAQAQKMEALGRLTGGIAHDFNNSLTVILGYAGMLVSSGRLSDDHRQALTAIREAGIRSKDLVGQLLSFSRQQLIAPKPLDLNGQLAESRQLLQRLVGEDVALQVSPGDGLWTVLLDPTQLHQVLMNLAANARDAMPKGGTLTFAASNVVVAENDSPEDFAVPPGEYVLLAVSDTGIGMEPATVEQMFEPFFTTKPPGQGTGLGLATVYGIVRQNRGFLNVQSRPGTGTTFNAYFPRHVDAGDSAAGETQEAVAVSNRGSGSILLVDDDELVRKMTADALVHLGYTPLVAANGEDAIRICQNLATPIDLVISDVVMPGIKGAELHDRLLALRPQLKVLFVSGYATNVVLPQGLKPGVEFLRKPFSVGTLGAKLEEILA